VGEGDEREVRLSVVYPRLSVAIIGGVIICAAFSLLAMFFLFPSRPMIDIKLKRYGRTLEGLPVAWLVLSNQSDVTIRLDCDSHPVSTAFTECEQRIGNTVVLYTNRYFPSYGTFLRPTNRMSIRVLLPTNGYPVKVTLLGSIQRAGRVDKALHPVRIWLYRRNWISPLLKIPVPFELKATNVVTKFVQ
jgi:hypothetical protein